ncbi:DUF4163 domain-containing protein [Heliobacterium chlorum]|uniref:DUF4163 domain-containing protein n=1 Tax=Heliobacterium chlorum TaxID=2698 RepID=A0ABR7T106_HELCL|nr:stalk domain-containing protein [Heliobacterium chlorum]MBC9784366.1 DUF4163 domain-containing protein [Heliobacterium chlorum]
MHKRSSLLLISAALWTSAIGTSYGSDSSSVPIQLDGTTMPFSGRVMNDQTFVPLRDISELLNFSVKWDESSQSITLVKGSKEILLHIGKADVSVNGHDLFLNSTPEIIDDRAFVPLRFIAENLGTEVKWQPNTHTVALRSIPESPILISNQKEQSGDSDISIKIQYPQLDGLADPTVQTNINRILKERVDSFKKNNIGTLRESLVELHDAGAKNMTMAIDCNYEVKYNQNGLISFFFRDYIYSGGAHGMTYASSLTLNTTTGKVYSLPDLFQDDSYVPIINRTVSQYFTEQIHEPLSGFTSIPRDQNFYLSPEGLVVYFQLYEYTPYAYGFPEVVIPYTDLDSLMTIHL